MNQTAHNLLARVLPAQRCARLTLPFSLRGSRGCRLAARRPGRAQARARAARQRLWARGRRRPGSTRQRAPNQTLAARARLCEVAGHFATPRGPRMLRDPSGGRSLELGRGRYRLGGHQTSPEVALATKGPPPVFRHNRDKSHCRKHVHASTASRCRSFLSC